MMHLAQSSEIDKISGKQQGKLPVVNGSAGREILRGGKFKAVLV